VSGLLTFTNLFPNAAMPTHGLFVRERMARVARELGWAWHVVAPAPVVPGPLRRGEFVRWAELPLVDDGSGVPVHHPRYRHWPGLSKGRQPDRMARAALPVVRAVANGMPWVVDAHYLYPDGVAAAAVARELGLPYVLTARGSDVNVLGRQPAIARRIRDAARDAHACFAVSEPLAEAFGALAGRPVECLRNGVDLERFAPGDAAAARRALALPAAGPLLLGVGRLVPGKGFADAVAALDRLDPGVRLVLIGDGPERARLAAAGGDRVLLLGTRPPEDVALAYQACDALVLPSRREGWPNVVTEALASGCPVVACAVGGIPDILGGDPAVGATVPVGDAGGLAGALARILAQGTDRAQVRRFATRYSWEEPVARMAQVLRAALP